MSTSTKNNRDAWMTASTNEPHDLHEVALQACDSMDLLALKSCPVHALSEVHLRLIVMKKHAPAAIVKYMVQRLNLCASEALDVAAGPRMVKLLLSLGANASKFTFFDSGYIQRVADDRQHSETFRRTENLFPAMGLRVLAGATLPPQVCIWFDFVARRWETKFMIEHGSGHMMKCYSACRRQFESNRDSSDSEDVIDSWGYWPAESYPSFAAFLAEYARYTKYLPVVLYIRSTRMSHEAIDKSVKMMLVAGASEDEVDTFVTGASVKKLRKIRGKVKKDGLYALVQGFLDLGEDGVSELVLSFL